VRVDGAVDGDALARCYASASAIQLDAAVPGLAGGTGTVFDWRWYPRSTAKPWILAGGLNADNVGAAVRTLRPYAVDVSSGVETAPGIKDHARMRAFCAAVRAAEQVPPA
jgi:phosphoribosylanthranilate isomerase